jgi:regulator of sigma E protease
VIRNGKIKEIIIPENIVNRIVDEGIEEFIVQAFSFSVAKVISNSNADKAGLKDKDVIIAVDSTSILYYHQFVEILKLNAGNTIDLQVLRNNDTVPLPNVEVTQEGTIGFQVQDGLIVDVEKYPFLTSFVVGNQKAWFSLKENTLGFVKVIRGDVDPRKALHGPISIAKRIYGGVWIWEKFWYITGLLSLILAFMNILPIPALDGGHVITIFIEMITGRPLKTKVMEVIQTIGLIIIFGLMILVVFNDIIQNFF